MIDGIRPDAIAEPKSERFRPKLEFSDRCAILALLLAGVKRPILAAVFDVDERTIGHIGNFTGPKYKRVREEYKSLGPAFAAKYVTEEMVAKVNAAVPSVLASSNSPGRARQRAGMHIVQPEQCRHQHRVEIKYLKADEVTTIDEDGWYYRDITEGDNELWLHNGEESRATSNTCYHAMLENLMDD